MKKFSRMILDSLKVTDDDDEFEDDDIELKERKEKREKIKKHREEREASVTKKAAPTMRRFEAAKYEEEDDEEQEDEMDRARRERSDRYRREKGEYTSSKEPAARQPEPKQLRTAPPMRSQYNSTDVCILRPKRFEECQEIIDVLKSGRVIFLTFDTTNPAIANRIMDFSFGAVYALEAQIIQLSGNNFVIAPQDAEISGEYINALTAANYGSWNNGGDNNGKR